MVQPTDITQRKAARTPPWWRQLIDHWRGKQVHYDLTPYVDRIEQINALGTSFATLSDEALRAQVTSHRDAIQAGQPAKESLIELLGLAREASERALGLRPYDVQLVGAIALIEGNVAEMETGEGKTLVAALAASLLALQGQGVHIVTVNDYLARRDAEWMGQLYQRMGLTVDAIQAPMLPPERQQAYAADITYLTAKEAGFDYLRDGLYYEPEQMVLRPLHVAIVDEADSILIDEARIPLVIAGTSQEQHLDLSQIAALVETMKPGQHFVADRELRNVSLTEDGIGYAERALGIEDIHAEDGQHIAWLTAINQALHARALLHRDVDYIIREGAIELVDELTGRVVHDRQWPDGLQAAIEAKEGLVQSDEGEILGSITLQHYFRKYTHLAGMTATARSSEQELREFYELGVVVIPTHHPCIREDRPPQIFTHKAAKHDAIFAAVEAAHAQGRPVLVGTASVRESEQLAAALSERGLPCQVLNARHDAREAEIVADAGAIGAITISTNMAGRGTDIRLGGKDERDRQAVIDRGGLYVIGTNLHESRRIDRQLRGRAGRQGDPGTSEYFVSLEDDTIVRNGIDELIPDAHKKHQSEPIGASIVAQRTAWAQRIIEGQHFDMRRTLWQYTSMAEKQRGTIREWRDALLLDEESPDLWQHERPERTQALFDRYGEAQVTELERRMTIASIDHQWTAYLRTMADIREHIHMVRLGNLSPLQEFLKLTARAFGEMREAIDQESLAQFDALALDDLDLDALRQEIQGPSSTWTYMVDDNPYRDMLGLQAATNIALGIGAAIYSPLYIMAGIYHRWFKRPRKERKDG